MSIDQYGHCVNCHRDLIIERVVDGAVVKTFAPDHSETEFMLDDGSRMRVCICKLCKEKLTLSDKNVQTKIMDTVKAGWQLEVDTLVADPKRPDWDTEKGRKHMDRYNKKKIYVHSEHLADHQIEANRDRLRKIKDGPDK